MSHADTGSGAGPSTGGNPPTAKLTLLTLTAMVVGSMVGAGRRASGR
ncbi:hypothetical protein [Streptomyces sp. NPDC088757]